MAYKKDDRVKYKNKGRTEHGTVLIAGEKCSVVADGSADIVYTIPSSKLEYSDQPMPPEHKSIYGTLSSAKKGDVVEYEVDGEVRRGVVENGGAKRLEVKFCIDGIEQYLSGPPYLFRSADVTPADEPASSPMGKWAVKSYKVVAGHDDTEPFEAVITKDGKPVIRASNDGWGGCNMYYPEKGYDRSVVNEFEKDVVEWYRSYSNRDPLGADELWISWYRSYRPLGQSSEEYIKKHDAFMDKYAPKNTDTDDDDTSGMRM